MAITLIGTPQIGSNTNGGNVTLTFSTTPSQDDYVLVFGGSSSRQTEPAAPGSGYTLIDKYAGASGDVFFGAWYKKMGASPDSSVVCNGNGNAADATAYGSYVLRGVDLTTPMDATATSAGPTTSTNPNAPSITTVTNGAWVFALAGNPVNDASIADVSGYSNPLFILGSDTRFLGIAGGRKEIATAGAENPPSWTQWSSGNWYAITAAFRPAGTAAANTGASLLMALMKQ